MAYTTINKPTDHFREKLYNGNSTDNTTITWDETGTNFGTNLWLWIKNRTASTPQEHWLTDSLRGATNFLESNSANAQSNAGGNFAYTTNGFVVDNNARTNRDTVVAWGWKAGASASNTDGDITSTVAVNSTAGFSIVKYAGSGTPSDTVGHGLGSGGLDWIIAKEYDASEFWRVKHKDHNSNHNQYLNNSNAEADQATSIADGGLANLTASNTFGFVQGTSNANTVNESGKNYIAYCFKEVKGFSKFGVYKGNANSNGPFIYLGFRPAWLLIKHRNGNNEWEIYSSKRTGFNPSNDHLNAHDVTNDDTSDNRLDLLSNGFKIRAGSSGPLNASTGYYLYAAFAEAPIVGTNNVPVNAR